MPKLAWPRRILNAMIALPLLTGCAMVRPEPIVQTKVVTQAVVKCGHLSTVTPAQQKQAADELDKLPADSVIANVIVPDWQRQRDEARACQKTPK